MQPQPTATDQQTATNLDPSENNTPSSQHGHKNTVSSTPPLSGDESGGVDIPESTSVPLETVALSPSPLNNAPLWGSSPPQTPSSQRNRIAEYENAAFSSSKKKLEGPAFEVVKKTRPPGDKRSPIAELPNGGHTFTSLFVTS